jgi:thiamine biosynthesis lipoprotein
MAFACVADVHRLMSFHAEDSDLARLRRAGPDDIVQVDSRTAEVLRESKRLNSLSGGVFDISIAPQLVRWGYLPRPPDVDLRRYRGSSLADLDIYGVAGVRQRRPLLLDLGGIAKGYAVDCAIGALREAGTACGLVNAGGDLRVFGALEAPVALRAPDWSGVIELRRIRDRALASSGNADRRRRRGARSPHLQLGGKPVLSNELAVVEAPSAMLADALTKVVLADVGLARTLAPRLDARVWLLSAHSRRAPA